MSTRLALRLALLGSLLAGVPACRSTEAADTLDGALFDVQLVPDSGDPGPDQLVFDVGRFESTACRAYGFGPCSYDAEVEGGARRFEATARASDGSTTEWHGSVVGDRIEGTMLSTQASGERTEYHYSGRRASGHLDGRAFSVRMVEGSGGTSEGDPDDLTFASGGFDSSACRPYGFGVSPYTSSATAEGETFEVRARNGAGEENSWRGVVRGDAIEGTMEYRDAGGALKGTYRFQGTRAPAGGTH